MDAPDPVLERWRERCWAADTALRWLHGSGAPHRSVASFGQVVAVSMGVPETWGVQVGAGLAAPQPADVDTALAWCHERGARHGWKVSAPASAVGTQVGWPWDALVSDDRLPMFAAHADDVAALDGGAAPGLGLDDHPSFDAVISGYGGWMSDDALARLLVVPDDLVRPERRFVVGRVDGSEVGCAFVWFAGGTGYLSGLGVLPGHRGRGYGRALTAAAARLAAAGPGDGPAPDLVWMHATEEGAALYARMGFVHLDTEVQLRPAA